MNKYTTKITELGRVAKDIARSGLIILFNQDHNDFTRDFAFLHPKCTLRDEIEVGDEVLIDGKSFEITNLAKGVNRNLKTLGHVIFTLEEDSSESNSEIALRPSDSSEEAVLPELDLQSTIIIRSKE